MGEALLVRFGMADGEVMVDARRVAARATQGVALQVMESLNYRTLDYLA